MLRIYITWINSNGFSHSMCLSSSKLREEKTKSFGCSKFQVKGLMIVINLLFRSEIISHKSNNVNFIHNKKTVQKEPRIGWLFFIPM